MTTVAAPAVVTLKVQCTSCRGVVVLECEGLPAYMGYQTYHEYFCPRCRKRNVAITDGAIISARAAD
jgi:Zn finger protein HypA/HybF involved in hydrogenase expression